MHRDDIDLAIDWAAKEGWNTGIHDGDCFYKTWGRGVEKTQSLQG